MKLINTCDYFIKLLFLSILLGVSKLHMSLCRDDTQIINRLFFIDLNSFEMGDYLFVYP